jgi:hypothetical protein
VTTKLSSGTSRLVPWLKFAEHCEDRTFSIFGVEEQDKHATSGRLDTLRNQNSYPQTHYENVVKSFQCQSG